MFELTEGGEGWLENQVQQIKGSQIFIYDAFLPEFPAFFLPILEWPEGNCPPEPGTRCISYKHTPRNLHCLDPFEKTNRQDEPGQDV